MVTLAIGTLNGYLGDWYLEWYAAYHHKNYSDKVTFVWFQGSLNWEYYTTSIFVFLVMHVN